MKKIVLIGAGGHCKSCIDVILSTKKYDIVAILGQSKELRKPILNYTINGTDEDIDKYVSAGCEFIITVGQIESNRTRLKIYKMLLSKSAKLATIISPNAYISPYAKIQQGTIVMHQALVNSNANVGSNCIINTKALIEHDAIIEDHCHISTGTIINGEVIVREHSFIGSNTTTKQTIEVKRSTFIKAGTIVK